jgi:hypothetical protein
MTNYLGIDIEALRDGDYLFGNFRTYIDLHAVSHIEYLIHFLPIGARALVDSTEEGRNWEHVVLDDLAVVVDKV